MQCPKCYSTKQVKSGFTRGIQRYKCKQCKCNFTRSDRRGISIEVKIQALQLYLEGMGFRAIGRVLKVSNVSVLRWIRSAGEHVKAYVNLNLPNNVHDIDVIEMDEMWHFTVKKNENYGSGLLSKDVHSKFLDSQLGVVVKKL